MTMHTNAEIMYWTPPLLLLSDARPGLEGAVVAVDPSLIESVRCTFLNSHDGTPIDPPTLCTAVTVRASSTVLLVRESVEKVLAKRNAIFGHKGVQVDVVGVEPTNPQTSFLRAL